MIYFTSDLHLGHNQPFLYEPRGFNNIADHDKAVIKSINETVGPNDTLWILGDIIMNDSQAGMRKFAQIKCMDIHMIRGNHDTLNKMDLYDEGQILDHGYATMMKYGKKHFYLSHYPTLTADTRHDNLWEVVINLHGHTHSDEKFHTLDNGLVNRFMYNVCWDAHHRPVSIEEIIEDIRNCKDTVED